MVSRMTHGGKRGGAGRPRKVDPRQLVNFTISSQTLGLLREKVSRSNRSRFVEIAINQALESGYPGKKEARVHVSS